ncbi:MAG: DsbE family thiol:disulfide interchange protein [Gammaproteobacteria bacterium]|jgi:cytochrome c biogenesis protein CcmG/thiol:disulfide interchange protein DsbE
MRFVVYAVPVVVFVAIGALFYKGLDLNPTYIPSPLLGKPAPVYELPTLTDPAATTGTRDLLGQVSLVNVWATWCPGCRQEHPFLVELARQDIVPIYGVNWRDDRIAALQWLNTLGNPYVASAFDLDGSVAIDWGVYGAPETFLVAPDGTVLYKHIAPLTPVVWEREFLPRIIEQCGALPCPRAAPASE